MASMAARTVFALSAIWFGYNIAVVTTSCSSTGDQLEAGRRFLTEEDCCEGIVGTVNQLVEKVAVLEAKQASQTYEPVAFKAHLTSRVQPANNARIVFDDVQLNLGLAYNGTTGQFVAPYNGTYMFSVSVCSDSGHYIVLDLIRNTAMIGRVLAGDKVYNDCSSETTVAELSVGDRVFLQHHGTTGDLIHASPLILDSFTGVLLKVL